MKYSQFNSIVSYNNQFYLYNSFTQKFIIIDPLLNDLIEKNKDEGIDNIKEIHPTFYSYLKTEEFLVQDNINELDKVKELVKKVDINNDSFLLTINPTMNCNFKCWYCYETHVKKSRFSPEMIEKTGKFIEKTTKKEGINHINIAFFGGEPLLYFKKDVVPVIEKLQKECVKNLVDYSVGFTTNGYLINDEFINFFKKNKISPSFQITLDGDKETHNKVRFVSSKKGSYEVIVSNIKKLLLSYFPVRLRINYTSENINSTCKIGDEFDDIPLEVKDEFLLMDFHRVWQDSENDDISLTLEKVTKKIKKKGIKVKIVTPNNVRESCYADKSNSAVINYNGDLFKCTARDFTTAERVGFLDDEGNLIWENNSHEKRINAKFNNKPCLSCRILPICNGSCSQKAVEALEENREYCVANNDDELIEKTVITKIKEILEPLLKLNEV